MSVGPGIVAKGDVEGCAKLLVQGHFEGNFEGQHLLVAAGGRYSGTAICATAQIDGLFEGELQADRLLTVSSSGRIQGGSIRFGRLDQQDGGIVSGDVEELDLLSDDACVNISNMHTHQQHSMLASCASLLCLVAYANMVAATFSYTMYSIQLLGVSSQRCTTPFKQRWMHKKDVHEI
eukprot:16264-Heterococcus_DN1.PRE.1